MGQSAIAEPVEKAVTQSARVTCRGMCRTRWQANAVAGAILRDSARRGGRFMLNDARKSRSVGSPAAPSSLTAEAGGNGKIESHDRSMNRWDAAPHGNALQSFCKAP